MINIRNERKDVSSEIKFPTKLENTKYHVMGGGWYSLLDIQYGRTEKNGLI
jgi:hypothetical protein